jgi:hypothetical protein
LAAVFACLPVFHLVIGIAMVAGWGDFANQDPMVGVMGWFFIVFAAVFILAGWAFAGCLAFAGPRSLGPPKGSPRLDGVTKRVRVSTR